MDEQSRPNVSGPREALIRWAMFSTVIDGMDNVGLPSDCGELRQAFRETRDALVAAIEEKEKLGDLYQELLVAVANKYDGETRHDTALRYIRERESQCSGPGIAALAQEKP